MEEVYTHTINCILTAPKEKSEFVKSLLNPIDVKMFWIDKNGKTECINCGKEIEKCNCKTHEENESNS